MRIFQGLLFLVLGVGLLLVIWRSLTVSVLPCGAKGLSGRVEFSREDQPVGYWLMFLVYGAGGLALVIFALRLFLGTAEPLPLR